MAATAPTRISKQAGNSSTVAFDFAFKIFAKTDLVVYKVSAAGVYTLGVVDVDYTVVFDTAAETGTVTYTVAPVTSGFAVIIGSALPSTQATAIPREGALPAATLRDIVDKLTILVQQHDEKLGRCAIQPLTPVNPGAIDIEAPVDGKALVWQDNGDGTFSIASSTATHAHS